MLVFYLGCWRTSFAWDNSTRLVATGWWVPYVSDDLSQLTETLESLTFAPNLQQCGLMILSSQTAQWRCPHSHTVARRNKCGWITQPLTPPLACQSPPCTVSHMQITPVVGQVGTSFSPGDSQSRSWWVLSLDMACTVNNGWERMMLSIVCQMWSISLWCIKEVSLMGGGYI